MKKTTIEFSEKMTRVINGLIDGGEARTTSEVVRNSVGLYHIAKTEQRKGNRIAIINSNEEVIKEIALSV